jgi:hypothetical protein
MLNLGYWFGTLLAWLCYIVNIWITIWLVKWGISQGFTELQSIALLALFWVGINLLLNRCVDV